MMAQAVVSRVVPAPAEEVWALLGDFNAWDQFIPRIEASRLEGGAGRAPVGAFRLLRMAGGYEARERLVSYDDAARSLAYEFAFDHPFPVRRYVGRVQVFPVTATGESFLYWTGDFDADGADEASVTATFTATYESFLSSLADRLGQGAPV